MVSVSPAAAQGWPSEIVPYEVAGIKLGDKPDDALNVLRSKNFTCNYNDLFGNDGRLIRNGYSGRVSCRSKESIEFYRGQRTDKTRIELTIAATDFDDLGNPEKDYVQKIVFREVYEDPPNFVSMRAALQE